MVWVASLAGAAESHCTPPCKQDDGPSLRFTMSQCIAAEKSSSSLFKARPNACSRASVHQETGMYSTKLPDVDADPASTHGCATGSHVQIALMSSSDELSVC